MRQGSNNRRSRGRNTGRRNGVPSKNQTFESNGPESHIRIRGNASQVHEKYVSLARDAINAGERILAENFYQHAEHYYRVVASINEANTQSASTDQPNANAQRGQESQESGTSGGQPRGGRGRPNGEIRDDRSASPDAEADGGKGDNFASDPRENQEAVPKAAPRKAASADKEDVKKRSAPSKEPVVAEANGTTAEASVDAAPIERQARPRRRSAARSRRTTTAPAVETAKPETAPASSEAVQASGESSD